MPRQVVGLLELGSIEQNPEQDLIKLIVTRHSLFQLISE